MISQLKLSGMINPNDILHQVQKDANQVIAPGSVNVPGVGFVPQYSVTIVGAVAGYNPAGDCSGNFMSYKFKPNNNCYAYACNIASNSFAQPGRMHGYLYPKPPTGSGVQAGAELDGLVFVGSQISNLKAHAATSSASGRYVALLISQADSANGWPGDYHWVRCDDNVNFQAWSQKDGIDQVTNFDFAGAPITDPVTATWIVNLGPISNNNPADLLVSYEFYAYMFAPSGGVSII